MALYNFKDFIIYEDENYLVINKPSGIASLEDRNDRYNLLNLSKEYAPSAQLCHRLDKETSGTLAIAKNEEAYRHLSIQFENRKVDKIYHTVVAGIHDFSNKKIDLPICVVGSGKVSVDKKKGKESITIADKLKAFRWHTLVKCKILTGRMHQIRVHMAALGAPIAGDDQYGGKPVYLSSFKKHFNLGKYEDERPIMQRVALHAFQLKFTSIDDKIIEVEAPYPKDFAVLIKQLNRYC